MAKMSESEVHSALEHASHWSETGEAIQRTFQFENFLASLEFVNRVGVEAERVSHHPDILIRYNKVTLTLSTHDAGGLTRKDFDMAATIDKMAAADE